MTKQEKVFDILNKFEFFQGKRAGRELWADKPKEVQDKDIADFIKDINYIRSYLQDSIVLSREEYEKLRSLYDCEQGSYMTSSIGDLPLTVEGLRKAVDEITRLNRVEVELQELNIKYCNEAKDLRRELKQARRETAEEILNAVVGAIDNGTFFRQNFIFMMNKVYGVEVQDANNDKTIEQANKKIVRQFYNKIQKMLDEIRQVIEEPCNGRQNAGYCVADVDNGLKELAKQFGLEIKE